MSSIWNVLHWLPVWPTILHLKVNITEHLDTWQIVSGILYWEEILLDLAWILLNVSVFYLFWSICHEAKQPFSCLPAVLVCFRGSSVRTGSVALEGRPTPALLTAQTLNWYRFPSFSPNTGKWHISWRCMLQRTHSPWLTSHLCEERVGTRKKALTKVIW